ncbi:unnamed protein product [Arabidopsis halleri]
MFLYDKLQFIVFGGNETLGVMANQQSRLQIQVVSMIKISRTSSSFSDTKVDLKEGSNSGSKLIHNLLCLISNHHL